MNAMSMMVRSPALKDPYDLCRTSSEDSCPRMRSKKGPSTLSSSSSTSFDGKIFEKKGKFSVKELKVEYVDLVANHKLLYNLSIAKNGKMFYPNELDALESEIYTQENIVSVSYTQKTVEDLIDWKWIFGLVLLLLTIEWFLRKRNGGY